MEKLGLNVQAGFEKGKGTRDSIANIHWNIEKTRELHKNTYFCFIYYGKVFDCVDQNKLWKILQEMEIPAHIIPEKPVCGSRSNNRNKT